MVGPCQAGPIRLLLGTTATSQQHKAILLCIMTLLDRLSAPGHPVTPRATARNCCQLLPDAVGFPAPPCRYGQNQWGGYDCKEFKIGKHGPGWSTNAFCALTWTKPVITSNLGFLVVVPAVAALAAVAVIGFRDQAHTQPACSRKQAAVALLQSWGSTQLPPK